MSNDIQSKSERELLKAVYRASMLPAGAHTVALAEALGLSPATVTSTVKRLAERTLVQHRPYHGVELTKRGRRAAINAIRRHRIVERFLSDMLGYAWNEADRLARNFENDMPEEVVERIFVAIDRPDTCPHGFPIPAQDDTDVAELPLLWALEPGERAIVAVPGSTQPEVVDFLATLGLRPGVVVEVREKHPFDGPLVLAVDGADRTVSHRIANQIFVRRNKGNKQKGNNAKSQ